MGGSSTEPAELAASAWAHTPRLPIEHALMTQAAAAGALEVVATRLEWTDVGNWESFIQGSDAEPDPAVAILDSVRCAVVRADPDRPPQRYVLFGLDNVLVVDCGDVVLLAHRGRAQEMKSVVDALIDRGWNDLL
jgi:mannose-1-phosphate guanylyltransferase